VGVFCARTLVDFLPTQTKKLRVVSGLGSKPKTPCQIKKKRPGKGRELRWEA
jgi:hypothetical protein